MVVSGEGPQFCALINHVRYPPVMRVGHFSGQIGDQGGKSSYIRRLGTAQEKFGMDVVYLSRTGPTDEHSSTYVVEGDDPFLEAENLNLDVLHLHNPVNEVPEDRVPTIRTVHNNRASCPSGTRYLKRSGHPCDRDYSVSGCLWGHLVDHCGSRRPQNTLGNFRNIHREQRQAAKLTTLTVSDFLKRRMIRSGCPSDNLQVLRSPAPSLDDSFVPPDRQHPPHFVFAGRITPMKGLDWLLRSVKEVQSEIHLDVAGMGNEEYMREMRQLSSELGIRDHVTFHGWLNQDEVYTLIRQSRALVFPSVWHEPAGLVTLEAAALGRAVVASNVGGIPEYAREEYATLVDVRDVNGLATAIEQLARNKKESDRRGRIAHEIAKTTFSMENFLRRLDQLYESVLL